MNIVIPSAALSISSVLSKYCFDQCYWRRSVQTQPNSITTEERDILIKDLLHDLEQRGTRQLKWYGKRWESGESIIVDGDQIPPSSQLVIDQIALRVGIRKFNVATIHRYQRKFSKKGTGSLKNRFVAITPHVDDVRLSGHSGSVTMVQLTGSCEIFLLNKSGTHKVLKTIEREELMAVTLAKEGFTHMRHALAWLDSNEDDEMITLTLRWL